MEKNKILKQFYINKLKKAEQIIFVKLYKNSINAKFSFVIKDNIKKKCKIIVENKSCVVGEKEISWLKDNLNNPNDNFCFKKEGDLTTICGIFDLTSVFYLKKYAIKPNTKMPIIEIKKNIACIDDLKYKDLYNKIIDIKNLEQNISMEKMWLESLYKYGIEIAINPKNILNNGSCVFIHLWRNENIPTKGCIAMSEDNLLFLINNLDYKKFPVICIFPDNFNLENILF